MNKPIFDCVKVVIDDWDPEGLLQIRDMPRDEYDGESRRIAEQVSKENSAEEIAEVISKVFNKSFCNDGEKGYFPNCCRRRAEKIKVKLDELEEGK